MSPGAGVHGNKAWTISTRVLPSTTAFYSYDPQGNQVNDLDSSGNTYWPGISDAYGKVSGTGTSAGGYTLQPYFNSQWGVTPDTIAGLYVMGHRDYDPNDRPLPQQRSNRVFRR